MIYLYIIVGWFCFCLALRMLRNRKLKLAEKKYDSFKEIMKQTAVTIERAIDMEAEYLKRTRLTKDQLQPYHRREEKIITPAPELPEPSKEPIE